MCGEREGGMGEYVGNGGGRERWVFREGGRDR